ncbi:hypothetical protein RhiirA4_484473 [Rhizophagus irregularis]|uniref:Uncharacterized protein n=1 Tax=Rhizophagus irregularis TaxID=588596 RepID=A0A2I1HNY4_9GLOM|nr:hypothetical protein RhiirA4_484473 [Rhizophagus irregularis]
MSFKVPHEYFKKRASDWNIIGFLNTCELESFQQIIENYLSSLESIIKTESSHKREKAQFLYDKYKKAVEPQTGAEAQGLRPDRVLAKKREEDRPHKQVHIHEPSYFDYGFIHGSVQTINGTITGGTFATGSSESKKDQEKIIHRTEKHKRDEYDTIEEDKSDDAEETVVEDVLFEYAKDLDYESHAHSFIICDHDDKMKTLFSKEDWKELTKKPSLPPVDYEIGKELAKYVKDDLAQLREEVMRSFLKVNEVYDPMEHYFKEWIQITMRHLCNLYENPSAPLCRDQYEDWFTNRCTINSSANRKNRAKKPKQRKLTGRKIDGIIHHPTYNMELGALEECINDIHSISNYFSKTSLLDFLKFLKAIVRSQIIIENNLKSLGFIKQKTSASRPVFGLQFQTGLTRDQFEKNSLPNWFETGLKTGPNDDDFKEEDLISEILGNDQDLSRPVTPPGNKISIVDCFETPHKKKNKPNKKTLALK